MTPAEITALQQQCESLPAAQGMYLIDDFVTNLMLTVLDFRLNTTIVVRARQYFNSNRWNEVRTLGDLKSLFQRFPNTKDGNTDLARYLWGYRYADRAELLRNLTMFFELVDVTDQESLSRWAKTSGFHRDFEGRVSGLGYAVFKWLVMRQGVETIKPDLHVRRFVEGILKRPVNDADLVAGLEEIAARLDVKAYELDWRIWESQRNNNR